MNLRIPLAVTATVGFLTGMVPVGFALTMSDVDAMRNNAATTAPSSSSSSSMMSSSSSMPFWNSSLGVPPAASTLGITCMGLSGDSLSQCLRQLGIFTGTGGMTGMDNPLMMQCTIYTGTQRSECERTRLLSWQMSYGMFRRWMDDMDRQLQTAMTNAGLTVAQVTSIVEGNLNVQTTNDGYADSETMRQAWEVCQQFDGRAQARCMRDALTNNASFENRFRGWADLQESLDESDFFNRSSSSSRSSRSSMP